MLLDVSGDGNRRKEMGFKRQFGFDYLCLVKIILTFWHPNITFKF